jgi:hypothetical protein
MTRSPDAQPRPWCFPCTRLDGSQVWAMHLGIACDWHWGILSVNDQEAMRAAVLARHPRGGRVRTVIEQLVVIRMDLRNGGAPNTVEETWAKDAEDFAEMRAANDALELVAR